jgi:hypothetical protein
LGTTLLGLTCLNVNAQIRVQSPNSGIKTHPSGGMNIYTPNSAVDFQGDRIIIRNGDNFYFHPNNHHPRSNTRRDFYGEDESQRVTCSQNERQSVRIRGSNQRVQQRIYSDCE